MAEDTGSRRAKWPSFLLFLPPGFSRSQSTTRTIFIAVALMVCCTCVPSRCSDSGGVRSAASLVRGCSPRPPAGHSGFELRRLLALPGSLDSLVVCPGLEGDLAWRLWGRGARTAGGTRATGCPVKADPNDRMALLILPRGPFDTTLALRAGRLPVIPIDHEGL